MPVIHITRKDTPGTEVFWKLTEAQLRNRLHPTEALVVVESPKVIRTALSAGLQPVALLCEERHLSGDAADIVARLGDIPIYTGPRELLADMTGYTLTRGVLCAMRRPPLPSLDDLCTQSRRLVVIDGVCDTTNIGAMFRSAAALGMDGILLTHDSCDAFNRRSIRVSMGTTFLIPWTWVDDPLKDLRQRGFHTVALALRHDSILLDDPRLAAHPRLALIMGTEGDGLPADVIDGADDVVRIPMARGIDSLNVAAAMAVACYQLRIKS